MDKTRVYEIISAFRKTLASKGIRADKLILFGSYAAGRPREDSDIDLVVISRDFTNKGYWERIDILADAIYDVFEPIEATAFTPEEWQDRESLIVDFAEKGEVLFD
jgi:predicted nucleotidyltransferase